MKRQQPVFLWEIFSYDIREKKSNFISNFKPFTRNYNLFSDISISVGSSNQNVSSDAPKCNHPAHHCILHVLYSNTEF